jgi:uncharacterized secreted protein with C-terminal beta-propeller domain
VNDEFKKKYREEMNRQFPSGESLKNLEDAMGKASRKSKAFRIRSLVALAACFALIIAFSGPIMNFINKPNSNIGGSTVAESYEELYTLLSELRSEIKYEYAATDRAAASPAAAPQAAAGAVDSGTWDDTPEFSDTNLQVAGVQEADIVKTDGKYIYALSNEYLYIVSAVDGELQKVSQIARNISGEEGRKGKNSFEMYVNGDRLIVLTNYYSYYIGPWRGGAEPAVDLVPEKRAYIMPYFGANEVGVEIYDISDRANPRQLNTLSQSGSYVSSRMIGDALYLVSNHSIYSDIAKDMPETYVPQVYRNGEGSLLEAQDICIAIAPGFRPASAQYLVVSGIDTSGGGEIVSTKSILGYGNTVYSSEDNLYVAAYSQLDTEEDKYSDATKLYRFSLRNGNIEFEAEGIVPGTIINQFAMDEHKGTFRIVTTIYSYTYSDGQSGDMVWRSIIDSKQYNALYTIDLNLNIIGKIENLAPDERVYSVRFLGDTGYFVTFRQVDPLFAVDLSDPANPVILSALKIPGFSEYLHPFADGLLFGLGKDADEASGRAGFLKLSMFDISDPADVSEINKLIINDTYYSEVSYNHKAILIDSTKNIIAFPADGKYFIYSYSRDKGFEEKAVISLHQNDKDYYYYYQNLRGLYIGDYLYVVSELGISSYSMQTYRLQDTLDLRA